jgi:DNA polymerase-3 subunit delta'
MEVIGHQKQRELLKGLAESGRMSRALLFSGQEKLGKKTIALEWASSLLGCDLQKVQHPDFILIEPEKKEIQIDQIRELIQRFSLRSSSFKIALINEAHLMNQAAQTCFLKTLEEPKGQTCLILISESPRHLLPTILSRVQTIKFYPVEKEKIRSYLKKEGVLEKEIEEILQISLGRPGVAVEFISDKKKLELFREKIKEIVKVSGSPLCVRFPYAKDLSQDSLSLSEDLDVWLSYFRNVLLSSVYQKPSIKRGEKSSISSFSLKQLKNIIKRIQTTKFLISATNANPRLALENLMLEF